MQAGVHINDVRKFLLGKRRELLNLLEDKRNYKRIYPNLDIDSFILKLDLVESILKSDNLLEKARKIEMINGICDVCSFTRDNLEYLFDLRQDEKEKIVPFGLNKSYYLRDVTLEAAKCGEEKLREILCHSYGLRYITYEDLLNAKNNGIKDLEYQSGVILDDDGNITYRSLEHPYLVDSHYIFEDSYVPKSGSIIVYKLERRLDNRIVKVKEKKAREI